jgi:putative FmdB family regulatory protein
MPVYEYHCNHCGRDVSLFYKSYKEYDAAQYLCPECGSAEMTRLISRVAIAKGSQNYASMSSNEMLNVLGGGNQAEVGDMMRQLGQDKAAAETLGSLDAGAAE